MSNSERALLCCISLDPAVIGMEVLTMFRNENPFSSEVCRRIYHAWATTDKTTWNTMAIIDKLERSGYKADWFTEVREIQNAVPHCAEWRGFLDSVRNAYIVRKAKLVLQESLYKLDTEESPTETMRSLARTLISLDVQGEGEQDVNAEMEKELERRRNTELTIRTGLDKLDSLLGALIPGDILILAARPSVGKSVVAHNIIRNIAQNNCPVGVFSLEMPIPQVMARLIAGVAPYDSRLVLDSMHRQEVHAAYEWLRSLPIYYDDRAGLHVAQICNKIRRWHTKYGIKVVVIDYIQLVKTSERKSNEGISIAMKEIKSACSELGIVPIVLAQVNRDGKKNEDGRPTLEDLKGSGSLEEDASYVVLMHRDVVLDAEQRERVEQGGAVDLEFSVAKNRHGSTGYNRLKFVPKYCLVQDNYIEEGDMHDAESSSMV